MIIIEMKLRNWLYHLIIDFLINSFDNILEFENGFERNVQLEKQAFVLCIREFRRVTDVYFARILPTERDWRVTTCFSWLTRQLMFQNE